MKRKALFAISSLGLGHATRTLAVINYFKIKYDITIISYGNTLHFLEEELKSSAINFMEFKDYPKLERGDGFSFYFYLLIDLIKTNFIIRNEHKKTSQIENDFDFIFSDGRYGIYSKKIPSFILSHQISFIPPKGLSFFKFFSDLSNCYYFRNFNKLFIPDFKSYDKNLAGNLSHANLLKFCKHEFVGILSSYKKINIEEDIDYLFIISGYLQDTRDKFISKLLEESKKIDGKKVFVLGDTSKKDIIELEEYDTTIYPSVTKDFRNELFCRAKVIVSRAGYTTIMDLVELDKKAILFPTPNQTEQEYLAKYYKYKNNFVICEDETEFDLQKLALKLEQTKPLYIEEKTAQSLLKIEKTIESFFRKNFFSIVMPAYNEEKYISLAIEKLSTLDYDENDYEIIVVENGSNDDTYKKASSFKSKISNLQVYSSKKGVSKAKNYGLKKVSTKSDFTIFLDADTTVDKDFLKELNNYINSNDENNLSIGTTTLKPLANYSLYDTIWYKFYDFGHWLTKTSYSIQIAKTDIAKQVEFDETLNYSEDLKFIKNMQVFGNFFFFHTKQVATSNRRFKKEGYFKTFLLWNIQALTPESFKKNRSYNTIR